MVERTHTDEQLIGLCAAGREDAFRALFDRHQRMVYNLTFRMMGNHADAEELVPEVFVKAWQSAAGFRGGSRVSTWLYRIAANMAMDRLRTARYAREMFWEDMSPQDQAATERSQDVDGPELTTVRHDDQARLGVALGRLGPEDRLLVTLYHLQDCSYAEIEEVTGISTTNIKSRLFRARRRLRTYMEGLEKGDASDDLQEHAPSADGLLFAAAIRR